MEGLLKYIVDANKTGTILPRVMRAAVRLFVAKGIDGTTIKDIAAAGAVSEGALYRHYKSKEDLAHAIFATHVNEFSHELTALVNRQKPGRAQLRAFVAAAFEAFETERDLFTYLILSEHRALERYPATFKHPGHVALEIVRDGQTAGAFQKMDPYIAASLLLGSVIRLCVVRFREGIGSDLRRETDTVADALWRALKK